MNLNAELESMVGLIEKLTNLVALQQQKIAALEEAMGEAQKSIEQIGDVLADWTDNTFPDIRGDISTLKGDVRSIERSIS